MKFWIAFVVLGFAAEDATAQFRIAPRSEWKARQPQGVSAFFDPAEFVIIHHTTGNHCFNDQACEITMRILQDRDMDVGRMSDIAFNFCIGDNGNVAYEGRGWRFVGGHADGYNSRSVGIASMGSFSVSAPSFSLQVALWNLINLGVSEGYIAPNHKLIGHHQIVNLPFFDCPGPGLYGIIQTWPNWVTMPRSDVEESQIAQISENTK